jgi:protein TonB
VLTVLLLLLGARLVPEKAYETLTERLPPDIVWIAQPGPGGGGGGNPNPEPPKPAETVEPIAVPAVKPPDPTPVPVVPLVEPPTMLPTETLTATLENAIGAMAPPSVSPGGRGAGDGAGPGKGDGVGPGSDRGAGGDVYRPGNGVESPTLIRQVRPAYTPDAVLARVQGTVGLDCVVQPDGTVGPCEIAQPIRPAYGLDAEAIKAARQWRFRPGTRLGEPVPVLVRIELIFSLR